MTSDVETPSRFARLATSSLSSGSRRTDSTVEGTAPPRVGRPRCIGWGHPDDEAVRRYLNSVANE